MQLNNTQLLPHRVFPQNQRRIIRHRAFVVWRIMFYVVSVGLVGGLVFLFLQSSFWQIEEIEVSIGQCGEIECLSQIDIKARLEELVLGKNIIFTRASFIANRLQSEYPPIESVTISKKYPSGLTVALEGREPVLGVVSSDGSRYLVCSKGVVFATWPAGFNLPEYKASGVLYQLGDRLEPETSELISNLLPYKGQIGLRSISAPGSSQLELIVSEDIKVYLNTDKDISVQLDQLVSILEHLRLNNTSAQVVDFRYGEPLVR